MSQSIWQNNFAALRERHPRLAERLAQTQLDQRLVSGRAGNGQPILALRQGGGQPTAFNSPQDPASEALQWVQSLGQEALQYGTLMVLGWGTGYHLLTLFQQCGSGAVIWVVEPDLAVLKASMHLLDFRAVIASERVFLLAGVPVEEAAQALFAGKQAHRTRAQGVRLVYPPFAKVFYQDYLPKLGNAIATQIQLEGVRFRTWEQEVKNSTRNLIGNLPAVLAGRPMLKLMGCMAGRPALVIAPGPSLAQEIEAIRAARPRVVLVAVDTAHRVLMRHGIEADLIVSVDFTPLNARHFDGPMGEQTQLAAFPAIDASILEQFEGRSFFFDLAPSWENPLNSTSFLYCLPSLGPLGHVASSGSTAHAAYYVARLMGCSPIVLVGNDLGFPGETAYAEGAMQLEMEKTDEEKQQRLLEAPSNDGGTVATSGLYKIYLDAFDPLIRETGGRVINASLTGARIDSAPYRPLQACLDDAAPVEIDKTPLRADRYASLEGRRGPLQQELKQLADEARSLRTQVRRFHKQAERVRPEDPRFRQQWLEPIRGFQGLFQQETRLARFVLTLCPRSHHELFGQFESSGISSQAALEQKEASQARAVRFFEEVGGALRFVQQEIESVQKQLG